ncbi:LAMI_0E01640g1_1 [Lachancea mirantina]|uniref:LAMI_0E01640g1_1 n=1 Tax=Lachancea mirantina TaxID=1230905 RepID=A0A1G4JJI2_9SACH|nr:LAMI_0E01640g1_1 [Lachancea mirantina]
MYFETYKNTFAVDVLEGLGLVKLDNFEFLTPAADNTEREYDPEKCDSTEQSGDGTQQDPYLVDFSRATDSEHPHNWTTGKRFVTVCNIMLLTCVTYMGTSIYTPGQDLIQDEFHVGHVVGTLNLSLYILGFGLGPLVFAPLSELVAIGRQRLFIVTLFAFAILQIGCALVKNIAGLIILRFLAGVFCSPSLANGAAAVGDVVKPKHVPVVLGLWAIGALAGPATGPLLGAAMIDAKGWRYMFWILMWISSATLLLMVFFFPETNEDNILYRRCQRIRKATGDRRYYTMKSKDEEKLTFKDICVMTLYRPFQIIAREPIVIALNTYHAVEYGVFYLFFEAFPIVFSKIYHFTRVQLGLSYLGFCVGCITAYAVAMLFYWCFATKRIAANTFTPETHLVLTIWVCWTLPCSLFLFAWAASVHWIIPMISEVLFIVGQFNIFQSVFSYLAMSYPKYMASVFAGNNLCRSVLACVFPLFGRAMYDNLAIPGYPVGWGSSLVGFLCLILSLVPFVLYKYGPYLRSRSKFAG